jgi:hypothetical protein
MPDQNVWDKATYRIFDLVWVPVMLMCKEPRVVVPMEDGKGSINIACLKEDFVYWPAVIQNIFKAPYRELWYGPLCIEEIQPGKIQVVSTQIFKNVRDTNIDFAYSVTLINLNMNVEIVLAEGEIKPYLNYKPPADWHYLTENDLLRLRVSTTDLLVFVLFNALKIAHDRATRIQPLQNSDVPASESTAMTTLRPDEYEISGIIFGPEVLKLHDVLRVKVKNSDASSEEFKLMHFRICTMINNKTTKELTIHGKRLHIDPALRKEDGTFMLLVDDFIWQTYSEICAVKTINEKLEKRILCMFQTTSNTLYQIQTERILGRFYSTMPEMHLDAKIEIDGMK